MHSLCKRRVCICLFLLIALKTVDMYLRLVMTVCASNDMQTFQLMSCTTTNHSVIIVRLALINNLERLLSSLDTRKCHSAKGRSHTVRAIDLAQLHSTHDQAADNLPRLLHNGILGSAHVQAAHTAELLNLLHAYKTLDREGAERAVVAGRADDEGRVDSVGVHAGLVVVMHANEGPVGDHAGDADGMRVGRSWGRASNKVFNGGGVEELDVGEGKYAGE
jgi:hypothetical protein